MTSRIAVFILGFSMALAAGFALAEDAGDMVPGTNSNDTPEVQAEIDAWLAEATTFHNDTEVLTALWDGAPAALPEQQTDDYVVEATNFIAFTQERSHTIRELSPGNDAACILRGVSLDVTERVEALAEARGQGAAEVVGVLGGIERLLYEGFLIFGLEQESRAETEGPIRVTFGVKAKKDSPATPASEECDAAPITSK